MRALGYYQLGAQVTAASLIDENATWANGTNGTFANGTGNASLFANLSAANSTANASDAAEAQDEDKPEDHVPKFSAISWQLGALAPCA